MVFVVEIIRISVRFLLFLSAGSQWGTFTFMHLADAFIQSDLHAFKLQFFFYIWSTQVIIFFWIWYAIIKNDTVKQHENHHSGTWEMQNKNMVEFAENNLLLFIYEFLKCLYSNVNSIVLTSVMQLLKNVSVNTKSSQWYLGRCRIRIWWSLQKTLDFTFMNF